MEGSQSLETFPFQVPPSSLPHLTIWIFLATMRQISSLPRQSPRTPVSKATSFPWTLSSTWLWLAFSTPTFHSVLSPLCPWGLNGQQIPYLQTFQCVFPLPSFSGSHWTPALLSNTAYPAAPPSCGCFLSLTPGITGARGRTDVLLAPWLPAHSLLPPKTPSLTLIRLHSIQLVQVS